MKKLSYIVSFLILSNMAFSQSAIFLHHSTGGNVYSAGDVAEYISNYNTQNSTDIQCTERAYPNTPYPWNNYAYDFWNLWVNEACDNESTGTECLESLASSYDIIIWKHCYPGAGISDSDAEGDVTSSSRTIPNYKAQYRALREKMDEYPNNQFIVWTLAPLHRLSTNQETAARAGEFVTWVKEEWLTEDSQEHSNIHIFDFFGIVAEQDASPANGFQFALKYDFEKSHESGDSHPNTLANETAGPLFAQFIIDVALGNTETGMSIDTPVSKISVFPNPTADNLTIQKLPSSTSKVDMYNMLGQKIKSFGHGIQHLDISDLNKGVYFLKIENEIIKIIKE